jgi:hypothetical protein
MLNDTVLEVLRALIAGYALFYLLLKYNTKQIRKVSGWYYIVTGFTLVFLGLVMDITDNFEFLNKYVIIGNTKYKAILGEIIGYLLGLLFIVVGLSKILPKLANHRDNTSKELLTVCSLCSKICDCNNNWTQNEASIEQHGSSEYSHSICPECAKKMYPEMDFSEFDSESADFI